MGNVTSIKSEEEFKSFIDKSKEGKILVDFYADWCGPCKMLSPQLDEVAKDTDVEIVKVNVDDFQGIASEYGVMGIPALKVVENGEVVNQSNGFLPSVAIKELLK